MKGLLALLVFCSTVLVFLPGVVSGQHREVDLEKRARELERQRVEPGRVEFRVDERFVRKRVQPEVRAAANEAREPQRARLEVAPRGRERRVEPVVREASPVRRPETDERFSRRQTDLESRRRWGEKPEAPLVRQAGMAPGFMNRTHFQAMADRISMADINRYQFQRNHSPEPGLREVRAGEGVE